MGNEGRGQSGHVPVDHVLQPPSPPLSHRLPDTARGTATKKSHPHTRGIIGCVGPEGVRSISVGTAHAYTTAVIDLLAGQAPGLLKVLRETDPEYVLLDGTLAECDWVGDGRADYSHKHRRHSVNVQGVTDPVGKIL